MADSLLGGGKRRPACSIAGALRLRRRPSAAAAAIELVRVASRLSATASVGHGSPSVSCLCTRACPDRWWSRSLLLTSAVALESGANAQLQLRPFTTARACPARGTAPPNDLVPPLSAAWVSRAPTYCPSPSFSCPPKIPLSTIHPPPPRSPAISTSTPPPPDTTQAPAEPGSTERPSHHGLHPRTPFVARSRPTAPPRPGTGCSPLS